MERSQFSHFYTMPVRWGDLDAYGHVNNVTFFRYFESGRIDYVEELMQMPITQAKNVILADIQCSFLQQLNYPATLEVATRIVRLGGASLHMESAIYRQGEDKAAATSKSVTVWFDFEAARAVRIPEEMRTKIREFERAAPEE